MADDRTPGSATGPQGPAADPPARRLAGMEPDPVTRRLVETYLTPVGYAVRWIDTLEQWRGGDGALAFLLAASALPELSAAKVTEAAKRLGSIPLLGMAGDRRRFPAECVPHPLRVVLRKPVRPDALMAALEALQMPQPAAGPSAIDGFAEMAKDMEMDAEMAADLCASFIERGEKYLLEAKAAADPRDNVKLERVAHAFKGMAGNMRLQRTTQLADDLQRAAREHSGDVVSLTRSLQVEFGAIRTLLQERWLKGR